MLKAHTQRYEMFLRVRDFGQQHRSLFPESSTAGKAFATVADAVAAIDTHTTAKGVSEQPSRDARGAARRDLRGRMVKIARTARVAVRLEPSVRSVFRLPRKQSDKTMLEAARRFIEQGESSSQRWAELGLPEDALAVLRQSVHAFERAQAAVGLGRNGSNLARQQVRAAFTAATMAVQELDVIVANALDGDPATFAVWRSNRRVSPKGRTSSDEAAPSAAVVETAPTPEASSSPVVVTSDDALQKAS